jgi:hypothetical protein
MGAGERRGWEIEMALRRVMGRVRGCAKMNPESKEVDPGDARSRRHLLRYSSARGRSIPATARYEHSLTYRTIQAYFSSATLLNCLKLDAYSFDVIVCASFAPSKAPKSFSSGVSSMGGSSSLSVCGETF